MLGDGLLQVTDDAVLVPEALAVGGSQGLHLATVLDAVPLQLDTVLVSLLLQLLEVRVLLQKTQQVGHHSHQGRFCQLRSTETHTQSLFTLQKLLFGELLIYVAVPAAFEQLSQGDDTVLLPFLLFPGEPGKPSSSQPPA